MLGMILEMLDQSGNSWMIVVDWKIDRRQSCRPQLNVLEVDGVLPDPLRPAGRLALVDGNAEVDVAWVVIRFLPRESSSGLRLEDCNISEYTPKGKNNKEARCQQSVCIFLACLLRVFFPLYPFWAARSCYMSSIVTAQWSFALKPIFAQKVQLSFWVT